MRIKQIVSLSLYMFSTTCLFTLLDSTFSHYLDVVKYSSLMVGISQVSVMVN